MDLKKSIDGMVYIHVLQRLKTIFDIQYFAKILSDF